MSVILVIEDNPDEVELMQLKVLECDKVLYAYNLSDALNKLAVNELSVEDISALFLDHDIPGYPEGYDTFQWLSKEGFKGNLFGISGSGSNQQYIKEFGGTWIGKEIAGYQIEEELSLFNEMNLK